MCGAEDAVGVPEQLRHEVAWDGVCEFDAPAEHGEATSSSSSSVVAALGLRELRPSQLELGVEPSLDGQPKAVQQRVVALYPRKPSEGEQTEAAIFGQAARPGENRSTSMAWPIAAHLGRPEWEGANIRGEDDVGEANRKLESSACHPMLVPEDERDTTRLRLRRSQQEKERDHMGEHCVRTGASVQPLPRARARIARLARACAARRRCAPGRSPAARAGPTPGAEHRHVVARSARAPTSQASGLARDVGIKV